jgi:AraC family transcriptional regulator
MTLTAHRLASGPGWRVVDVICTAGPHDRSDDEEHAHVSIAAVTAGTFQYRTAAGSAVMAPGALLLGNPGTCYRCGHDHGRGDRCLSFQLDPWFVEQIAEGVPGVRRIGFAVPRLPPLETLVPLLAGAEAARDAGEPAAFEETTVALVGAALGALAEAPRRAPAPNARDERRISAVLRRIEADPAQEISLVSLAREAAMSPFHFLRCFRAVAGTTPYRFVLARRLHRAALRLRRSDDAITAVAYEAGFSDLSTFNHRFRRIVGASPRAWRAGRKPLS